MKPNVAYLALNLSAAWKKQTTLPSLFAYAGIPYQVFGSRDGALALTIAWNRSAITRSDFGISAIFSSTSRSPSALRAPRRASAFRSWTVSFKAASSSSVRTPADVSVLVVRLAGFFVSFIAVFLSLRSDASTLMLGEPLTWRLLQNCSAVTCLDR